MRYKYFANPALLLFLALTFKSLTFSSAQCGGPRAVFQLNLLTDNYGLETTWTLRDNNEEVLNGGPYGSNRQYDIQECIFDGCYLFTIFDSYGDGICCSEGEGSYAVSVDGRLIVEGGEFTNSETSQFCSGEPNCQNSAFPIFFQNNQATCANVVNGGYCGNEIAKSHCPSSCNACLEYGCLDSNAPFRAGPQTYTCAELSGYPAPIISNFCAYAGVSQTCRGTCSLCFNDDDGSGSDSGDFITDDGDRDA